ncbi:MAG: alpha/beta fold hydrolase [Actinobacteria bacterium]|nr:MAG: alpha/beta fold hydrolase [Actinomycetota bacterium]
MSSIKPRRRAAAVWLLVLSLLASCAGGDDSSPSSSPGSQATTTTVSSTVSTSPTTSTTAAGSTTSTTSPGETTTTTPPLDDVTFESLNGIDTISDFSGFIDSGLGRWHESVDGLEEIELTSTIDGAQQPALWLPPSGEGTKPLIVILHSWSSGYQQHAGIPYALWAQENGWAMIAPQFRGINDSPDALGSDLAVQDVADAIEYATAQEGVRTDKVFAVGYSGGGMMSLLVAGRHPDKVSAVAAWGPPYDLIEFYLQSIQTGLGYVGDIEAGCGGDPTEEEEARAECVHRSPMAHLDGARESGVPVLIGHGINDSLLSPAQSGWAFNHLANSSDQFSETQLEELAQGDVPDVAEPLEGESFFGDGDPDPVLVRHSGPVVVVFFEAGHEMVYEASVRWFASDPG